MKVTIEIDEDELQKAIIDMVAKECARAYFKRDEYKGIEKAVKLRLLQNRLLFLKKRWKLLHRRQKWKLLLKRLQKLRK